MSQLHSPGMNGNGKLTYWLLGLLGTMITGGSVAWLSNINTLTRSQGERIAVLESQMIRDEPVVDHEEIELDGLRRGPDRRRSHDGPQQRQHGRLDQISKHRLKPLSRPRCVNAGSVARH